MISSALHQADELFKQTDLLLHNYG